MKRIAAVALAVGTLLIAQTALASSEASAGWRRCAACGVETYVYPKWRGYGWGFGPYFHSHRPFAHYPFWRGRIASDRNACRRC